ncbi:lipase 3-like [Cimex lectularius]|uniref:Lipase n=1 Tax=Cimex lectularius TaxID=79782 RepID=A0A8I6SLW5_CIMLE|nr:lipase 3-like [Cimex lectularius]
MKLLFGFALLPLIMAINDIIPRLPPNPLVSDLITLVATNLISIFGPSMIVDTNANVPEDFALTDTLVKQNGYGYEFHKVVTEDGYILSLHRILPRNDTERGDRVPVFIQHGVLVSSDSWLIGPRSSLAFLLADHGYEVWLGDQRGSAYSRSHVSYTVKDFQYWNFSFHESGMFDIPAFIDQVLNVTGKPQLFYIGHSMGTTVLLTMASMRPDYNAKMKAAVLLAPIDTAPTVSELNRTTLTLGIKYVDAIKESYDIEHKYEFLPRNGELINFIRKYCVPGSPILHLCFDVIGIVCGEHRANLDRDTIGKSGSYVPAGTSIKTMDHLTQLYKSGFRLFNYGKRKNLELYGTDMPPFYPLERVTTPIALYYGDNDALMNGRSADKLASMLPNLIMNKMVADPKFTHADYILGINAKEMVYDDVINMLESLQ